MTRSPQTSEKSSTKNLLLAMILLDITAFGVAPLLLWASAAILRYGLGRPIPWLIYLLPAEGFIGYLMLYCIPLEVVRCGLIVFGLCVWRGKRSSLRPFLLLLVGMALVEPLAAGGLLAISNQSVGVWLTLAIHTLLSLTLLGLTLHAARNFRSSVD